MARYQRPQPKVEPPPPQRIDPEVFGEDVFIKNKVTPEELEILLADKESAALVHQYLKLQELVAPAPEDIEAKGGVEWVKYYFGSSFTRPFTKYQKEWWEWGFGIEADTHYRPRVECEPRGVGKSTSGETWVVSMLARKRKRTIGYVSRTDDKATQHFGSIKRKLENPTLLRDYPHLLPRVQKYRNAFNSWSQDRLITDGGQTVIPVTLMGSNRGFKSEDDVRFDLIVLDDIDALDESPEVRMKNLEILKSEILAAGYANTLVVVLQNLVHRDSIVAQIMDHRADILSDRIFKGPYPLMKWYDAEKIEMEDGGRQWKITAGEPHDPAIDRDYCESLLNQFGKDTFDRECQQDVTKVAEDKDFREWDEIYHIITQSEMEAGFGENSRMSDANGIFIPGRWHVGRGLDWGTTRAHPSAEAWVARPDQTCPFDEAHFVFGEVVLPRYPYDAHVAAELVSPGRLALATKDFQKHWRVRDSQIEQSKMSHEASAAKNTLMLDLSDELTLFFNKWKAAKGSGVPQIQNMLEIDRKKPHPFRRYPQGYLKRNADGTVEDLSGQPVMGRPRIYFVVADGQGELYCDGDGKLRVTGAKDSWGLARCRYEMPLYSHRNSGDKKIDDDFVDALRGLMSTFGVAAGALTDNEKIQQAVPAKYSYEALLARSPYENGLTPELEMAWNYQQALAKQRVQDSTAMVTFDEQGNPVSEEYAERLW